MKKIGAIFIIFVIVIALGSVMADSQSNNARGGNYAGLAGGLACLGVVLFLVVAAAGSDDKKGGGKKK